LDEAEERQCCRLGRELNWKREFVEEKSAARPVTFLHVSAVTIYPFYVLVHRLEGDADTEYLTSEDANRGGGAFCDVCGLAVGSREWLPPFKVELESWGNRYGDFVFGTSADFLVSPRFKDIYDNERLKGLSGFQPVEIERVVRHKKLPGMPPAYLRVHVARSETAVDPVASGVEWKDDPVCPRCLIGRELKRRRRIVIDEQTWTGDDFFFARGLHEEFIASRRFKEVCEANGVTNAVFVPSVHRR
jgi:hypothetical protein